MRTLPLGVLIVCGGTFAALPFRRYHPIHPPILDPFQVTGPLQSALVPMDFESSNLRADVLRLDSAAVLSPARQTNRPGDLVSVEEIKSFPRQLVRRGIDIPLTFEDLAQPIEHPGSAKDRWINLDPVSKAESKDSPGSSFASLGTAVQESTNPESLVSESLNPLAANREMEGMFSIEPRQRWAAEQIFSHDDSFTPAAGRFASTPASEPLRQPALRVDQQGNADDKRYTSGWRVLPDVDSMGRRNQWITQP